MKSDQSRETSAGLARIAAIVVGVSAALATGGCSDYASSEDGQDSGSAQECQLDRDCPVGQRCTQEECVPIESGCVDDLDCDEGENCVTGECMAEADAGPTDVSDTGSGDADAVGCTGCYGSMGEESRICVEGNHNEACGRGGGACVRCDSDEYCDEGTCKQATCTPATCDGCCKDDECIRETTDEACGIDGERCETCSGESFCEGGECVAPCSAQCDGCCDEEGNCKEGDTKESCGTGGEACQTCGDGEECRGNCVETDCEVSCSGCCVDGTCKDGTSDEACGRDGNACQTCAESFGCEERATGGVCVLQDDSEWDLVAIRGKVPDTRKVEKTFGGTKDDEWDELSKPDVFLKVANDSASKSAETSVAKDSVEPSWEETTLETVRAEDWTGGEKTSLELRDDDLTGSVLIAQCDIQFKTKFGLGQFDGTAQEFTCEHTHTGETITPNVWLRLERH